MNVKHSNNHQYKIDAIDHNTSFHNPVSIRSFQAIKHFQQQNDTKCTGYF